MVYKITYCSQIYSTEYIAYLFYITIVLGTERKMMKRDILAFKGFAIHLGTIKLRVRCENEQPCSIVMKCYHDRSSSDMLLNLNYWYDMEKNPHISN